MKKIITIVIVTVVIQLICSNVYAQWTHASLPGTTSVTDLAFDGTTLYVATSDSGIYKTLNFATWTQANNGLSTLHINELIITTEGPNTVYYAATDSGVFRSTTSGNIWIAVNNGITNRNITTIYSDGTNLYAGTAGGGFRSSNYSLTWTPISIGATSQTVKCFYKNGSDMLAGLVNVGQYLYRSTDQGLNWSSYGSGLYETTQIDKLGNELFAVSITVIYHSLDNGATWNPVGPGLVSGMPVSHITTGNNYWWIATFAGGYVQHTDSTNFRKITNGMPSGGSNLTAVARNGTYVVYGTLLDGIWYAYEGSFLGLQEETPANHNMTISPNPVCESFQVSSQILQNKEWEYSIHDISGKIYNAGVATGEAVIDIRDLPAGIYILKINTHKEIVINKLIKL